MFPRIAFGGTLNVRMRTDLARHVPLALDDYNVPTVPRSFAGVTPAADTAA
jgi:hypothetical protein